MKNLRFLKIGFTLIELLVVISIIGILATIVIVNLNSTRGRARDAVRKSDMRQMVVALRLYFNDEGGYPCSDPNHNILACQGGGILACTWGTSPLNSRSGSNTYISVIPGDPVPNAVEQYRYDDGGTCTGAVGNPPNVASKFLLSSFLENASDQDITRSESRCTANFASLIDANKSQYVLCAY